MNIKKHIIIFTIISGVFLSFFHGYAIAETPDNTQFITYHKQSIVILANKYYKKSGEWQPYKRRIICPSHTK
ncbi:hypothetical protein CL657_04385 [bacterium]|nr:hypothetical protein [bacterium]